MRSEDELSAVEAKTGQPATGFGRRQRRMECVKEEGVWRVWREGDAFDDLAAALTAANTKDERSALLAADETGDGGPGPGDQRARQSIIRTG